MEEEICNISDCYKNFHIPREKYNNYELIQLYSDWLLTIELLTVLVNESKCSNFLKYIIKENIA